MKTRRMRAFSLVEVLVSFVITALIIGSLQVVFTRWVGLSQKGEDTITSMREAMITLENIRQEMMAATEVAFPGPRLRQEKTPFDIGKPATKLVVIGPRGTITYERKTDPQGRPFLEKQCSAQGKVYSTHPLNVGRLKEFEVTWLHQTHTTGKVTFQTKILCVALELQGFVGTTPATKIRVQSFITPPFNAAAYSSWP